MNAERILLILVLIGSGVNAGIFFAFSNFVMSALGRSKSEAGIEAMQQINITVINPLFFLFFLGTGVAGLPLAYLAWSSGSTLTLVSALTYVIGCVGVTIGFNVPLNDRLAAVEPTSAEGDELWQIYLTRWTFWNSVRTVACLLAMVGLVLVIA